MQVADATMMVSAVPETKIVDDCVAATVSVVAVAAGTVAAELQPGFRILRKKLKRFPSTNHILSRTSYSYPPSQHFCFVSENRPLTRLVLP